MEKNKRKISYLDKVLCLLSVIFVLLLVGVFTSPNNQNIMTNKTSTSMVINNQNMNSLKDVKEDELIDFLEDNNLDLNYTSYDLSNYYIVEFDSNGGTDIDSKLVEYGKTVSRPSDPIKSCYIFNGWYLNGERFYFSSQIRDNITLEAKWTYNTECDEKDTFVVKFDNGGGIIYTQTVIEGDKVIQPEDPTRDGYEFSGWYLNGSKYNFNRSVTKDITLEAKWTKVLKYTIKFDSNNGSFVDTQYIKYGGYVEEPTEPTREGYVFNGWYLNGIKYNFNRIVTKDITLEAKWTKEQYRVEFDSNNGSFIETQYVNYGEYVKEPTEPTREGYEFNGWYLNGVKYNFSKKVTTNLTLEAKWTKINYEDIFETVTYKVKFNSNGGSSVETQYVNSGEYVVVPDIPTRDGYIFDGWYLNENLYDFDTLVTKNITLKAKWIKETVKYNEYCKIETETHYSISYIDENFGTKSYDWTIKFDNINAKSLKITNVAYLSSITDYNNAYKYSYNKQISMVGGNSAYRVLIPSGNTLKAGSLKSHNFFKHLQTPYSENGNWYVEANVGVKDYYLAAPYYAENLKNYIYFVPFKFDIEYTNLDNCKVDLASRKDNYKGYSVVDTFYQ